MREKIIGELSKGERKGDKHGGPVGTAPCKGMREK